MSWARVELQDIALQEKGSIVSGPFGSNIGSRFFVDEGVPVIRGNNLTKGAEKFIDDGFVFLTESKAAEFVNCIAIKEDIIFTAAGSIGQVGIIPGETRFDKYIISNKQLRVRIDRKKAHPLFVYYWLSSHEMTTYLENMNNGGAVPLLNLGIIRKVPVPLPPPEVQTAICDILSTYDDLIENNRRRIKLLEQAARLLYKEWFVRLRFPGHEHVKIVDGVPEGWEKKPAYDVMDILSGGTPSTTVPDYWGGDIPFYTPKDHTDSPYVLETERSVTERGLSNCNSGLYPKNTVFISARGTVGKIIMPQSPMAMSQTSYALIGKNGVTQLFLYTALQSVLQQFQQRATGAVFTAIVVNTFKTIPFLVPMKLLVGEFEAFAEPVFAQIENMLLTNRRLWQARDLLLPRLMNGEIAV